MVADSGIRRHRARLGLSALVGSTWRFRRTACCNCGAQYSPQWRSGPEGPRTLCNACGVRYKKGLPLGCPMPSAQEPGVPAEPMEVQLSAEGTPGASSICMASPMSMPGEIPEPYSPDVSELEMHSGNSDEEGPARGNQWEEAHDGTEAHDGAAAQSDAGVAYPQVEYGQGEHQPAFQAILAKDTRAEQDQQGSAASTHALSHLQGQADALRPVLGIVGLLSMLAALLMPAGKLQYSKVCTAFETDTEIIVMRSARLEAVSTDSRCTCTQALTGISKPLATYVGLSLTKGLCSQFSQNSTLMAKCSLAEGRAGCSS